MHTMISHDLSVRSSGAPLQEMGNQAAAPCSAGTLYCQAYTACTACCRYGESVGDLDVVDGDVRSVTCIALDEGCHLVQASAAGGRAEKPCCPWVLACMPGVQLTRAACCSCQQLPGMPDI
jgi:hypothetical protein